MTQDVVATVSDCASRALHDFVAIQETTAGSGDDFCGPARTDRPKGAPSQARLSECVVDLIRSCRHLVSKFPVEARAGLLRSLPFTDIEIELLLGADRPSDLDEVVTRAIAIRTSEWVRRSPILVDEERVDVADFLQRLSPHLATWDERHLVECLVARLSHH